jgi:hypothetical protein
MTLRVKQYVLIAAITTAGIVISAFSRSFAPLLYVVFPNLAVIWVISVERRLIKEKVSVKRLSWQRKLFYLLVLPVLSILGLLFAGSAYHAVVPVTGFWITISAVHGIFIVQLYGLYVRARNKYGRTS